MKKLSIALLVLASGVATAQPAEQPTGGLEPSGEAKFVPPSDEPPPPTKPVDDKTGANAAATGHGGHGKRVLAADEAYPDPDHTKHFNWFGLGYRGKDQYGGRFGDGKVLDHDGKTVIDPHTGKALEEEPMSAPFFLMVLNFIILMGILVWKGRPAVRKLAAERHDLIKNALDEAAKLREQAAEKLAEYERKLKDADAEIKAMVEGMRKDAESDKARILDNAAKQSAQMKKDAEQRIAAEIELARATLTREVTTAAALATEKILRDKMMPGDQQKLVASFIADVGTSVQAAKSPSKERV